MASSAIFAPGTVRSQAPGGPLFTAAVKYAAGSNPTSVAVGDFNGDGKPDLAVAGSGVSVLLRIIYTAAHHKRGK